MEGSKVVGEDDRNNFGRLFDALQEQLKTHATNATSQIKAFQDSWTEQDRRAAEGRRILYGKVEEFGKQVTDFGHEVRDNTNKVAGLAKDVAEMKPAVEDWKESKNKAIGATAAVKTIWIVGGSVTGSILLFLGWLFGNFLTIGPHLVAK